MCSLLRRVKFGRIYKCLRTNLLATLTVAGVFSGITIGFVLRASREEPWSQREQIYVKFFGEIFIRILKALILPLIVSSLISAVGSLDVRLVGTIGYRAVAYHLFSTGCAVLMGVILVVIIHPGEFREKLSPSERTREITTADTLMDLVRNMFPPNLVHAALYQYQTILDAPTSDDIAKAANKTIGVHEYAMRFKYVETTNIMGLVVFSTVLGVALAKMGNRGKLLLDFCTCISEAMIIITTWVVWLSPLGVCFLISSQLIGAKDLGILFDEVGLYFITALLGFFLHGFVILPVIYVAVTRRNPFPFIANMTQALATAFGTASSAVTLPVTIDCLENKNGVDPRVTRFLIPIGATINMDGTALFETVAAIFIAQMEGYTLSFGNIIAICITAIVASIGAAGIPQAGLVTMIMILNSIGLPAHSIAYIVPVDWLLDRFRTTINVLGDSFGAGVVDAVSKYELEQVPIPAAAGINPGESGPRTAATTNEEDWGTTLI